MSKTICYVCCEKHNLSNHKEVICPFDDCKYSSCKSCIRTYLLGTTQDPHCMNCKKTWDQDFLIENLNRTFYDKDYKKHRKDLLVEREISKLPETMHLAEREKKIITEEEKRTVLKEQIKKLRAELLKLNLQDGIHINNIYRIKHGKVDGDKEIRKFIMACPNNECRGYLSTQYKCELCKMFTCNECLELIGYNKTDHHECDPNSVASAETIRKETKPCPSCGVRIFKISGCSQMWCTECKVAFDYKTGKIDTGTIHNPHYYNHMRQHNNGQAPRNPQDVVCGGLCPVWQLRDIYAKIRTASPNNSQEMIACIGNMHRSISHIGNYDLPRYRQNVRENNDNEKIRVNYILGNIDRKKMSEQIYRQDNLRKKYTELLHLYELINVVGIENINTFVHPAGISKINPNSLIEFITQKIKTLDNLRIYCNSEFQKISLRYSHKVTFINDQWNIESKKYKNSEVA
jgi:hypothetical protein